MHKPLLIDLYSGLHGWSLPFVEAGWRVIAIDIVDMHRELGLPRPPGIELVLQDVRTLNGAQLREAALIVASPPCQEFSYRAMPWKRAKALPLPVLGIDLFWQCWRIQHEASEAAGREIPLIVENVKGAQKWVGRAAWHYGSFYLWGSIPALMPKAGAVKVPGMNWSGSDKPGYVARGLNVEAAKAIKNNGGSWFAVGSPGQKDRKSTRLNSSHIQKSRMPSSA